MLRSSIIIPENLPAAKTAQTDGGLLPSSSSLRLIEATKDLHLIEAGWKALETCSHVPATVFSSYDWIKTWSDIYATPEGQTSICVVAGFTGHDLVFILPLMRQRTNGVTSLVWLTQPIGQYGDVLCRADQKSETWMTASLALLKKSRSGDLLHLRHVRQRSNIHNFANARMKSGQLNEHAPYLDMTPYKSETDYDGRYDSRQRKHRRRSRKELEEFGPLEFRTLNDVNQMDQAIDRSIEEKRRWLASRGRFSRTMISPEHTAFLKALARLDSEGVRLHVTHMSAGEKPISWETSFRYQGTHYCYMTAHDQALTGRSPGRLHFDYSQRQALAENIQCYDLMVPFDQYKVSLTSAMEPVNDYYLPLTMIGSVYGFGYVGTLRPLLRRAYQNMPVKVLRLLKSVLRH